MERIMPIYTSIDTAADARRAAAEALNQSKYGYGINDQVWC